eukprot:Gb_22296 [translate_table: standard]
MAMAMAAMAGVPSLAKTPQITTPQRILKNNAFRNPLMPQTRRFSLSTQPATIAKLSGSSKEFQLEPATAMGAAFLAALSSCDSASAAQQVMEIAANDNRGTFLLLPLVPALAWVLYNILQPALNQLNQMRSAKGLVISMGLGAGGAALLSSPGDAYAGQEMLKLAEEAASNDNRGLLLLIVIGPAILWVLYNILQPALNQLNQMRNR